MEISKTEFKKIANCNCYYEKRKIHNLKKLSEFDDEIIEHNLALMFDKDGEDLVDIVDEQLEIMLPYYNKVEEISLKEASIYFNKDFKYFKNTKDQKYFSFKDDFSNTLYTYVDGYYEDNDKIIIIEAKATTDKKFRNLGVSNKEENSIFDLDNKVFKLKENLTKKDEVHYKKLFDKASDCGKYIYDCSITNYIIKNSLKENKKVYFYLAIMNSKFSCSGEFINDEPSYYNGMENFITFVDVTDITNCNFDNIKNEHMELIKTLNDKNPLPVFNTKKCNKCEFKKVCFPFLNNPNTLDRLLNKKIDNVHYEEYFKNNIYYIKDLDRNLLDDKQRIQYDCICNNSVYFDKEAIKNEIKKHIKYPLYHLDFEGFNSPLPRFFKETAYEQSIFQFSLHIEKSYNCCDRDKDNLFFIANDFNDHRKELVEKLIEYIDLSEGGTVIVYNENYEKPRLKKLALIYPQYKDKLNKIIDSIYDIEKLVEGTDTDKKIVYYNEKLNGSYSIKKVLPCFSQLSYKDLDIHNGVEAIVNYGKFKYLSQMDIDDIRNKLKIYCGLDTYSMVVILDKLIEYTKD